MALCMALCNVCGVVMEKSSEHDLYKKLLSPWRRQQKNHGRASPAWRPSRWHWRSPSHAHVPCFGLRQRSRRRVGVSPTRGRFGHGRLPSLGWPQRRSANRGGVVRDGQQDYGVRQRTPLDGKRDYSVVSRRRQCVNLESVQMANKHLEKHKHDDQNPIKKNSFEFCCKDTRPTFFLYCEIYAFFWDLVTF